MWHELARPEIWVPWLLGMAFGILVGSTPGLTATMAVAILLPVTFHLPAMAGLAVILGVSFTAIFAGDIPATLLRIPGTPASAAATLDAYELQRQGHGAPVLLTNLFCSAIGGLVGVGLLALLAPQLARWALRFSSFEYFWLGVFGLSLSAVLTPGQAWKGMAAAALGVLASTVGWDEVAAVERYTWGRTELFGGLGFIPAMIGLFGLAEVFRSASHRLARRPDARLEIRSASSRALRTVLAHPRLILQSSLLGTLIGALPGAGADVAAWVSYGLAKRLSRRAQQFGQGCWEGVVAPTSANNAAVAGAWIPALVFGIPGDAVTAIVVGAMLMYNIRPGPNLFHENIHQLHLLLAIAFLTQLFLIPAGMIGILGFRLFIRLPHSLVMSAVVVFCVVGAYAIEQKWFHVMVMFGFGLLGLWFDRHQVPVAPFILGMILQPILELNLRQGLIKSDGRFQAAWERPESLVLMILTLAMILGPAMWHVVRRIVAGIARPRTSESSP
ncbi:MAG: C4-dicarboxylate ABC transporter permease [Pirellulaceae bacterium]|nr:MAG: C4-dicarboxylate ABC transporter permease [Pirellulaceae bacterium]